MTDPIRRPPPKPCISDPGRSGELGMREARYQGDDQ